MNKSQHEFKKFFLFILLGLGLAIVSITTETVVQVSPVFLRPRKRAIPPADSPASLAAGKSRRNRSPSVQSGTPSVVPARPKSAATFPATHNPASRPPGTRRRWARARNRRRADCPVGARFGL